MVSTCPPHSHPEFAAEYHAAASLHNSAQVKFSHALTGVKYAGALTAIISINKQKNILKYNSMKDRET
jgi:hypothetical protein